MGQFKGKVVIITGGSSGIGYAIAQALAGEGFRLTLAARNEQRLAKAVEGLKPSHADVLAVPTDVSRQADVRRMVQLTIGHFSRIDLLVNNAGVFRLGALDSITEEDWDETLAVNLKGAFLCTKAVLPFMKRQRSGYIMNISSLAGKEGMASAGAYCASKFGLIALTETLLDEVSRYNIKATSICPSYVATPMVADAPVPFHEMIQPQDVASTVLYLLHLSEQAVLKEIVLTRKGAE